MKTRIILICLLFLAVPEPLTACTTAIISGRFTPDGRPLLWKNRDTDDLDNKLMYFTDGRYDYIGLVNSKDTIGEEVWTGMNTSGFAIMNSASYNLTTEKLFCQASAMNNLTPEIILQNLSAYLWSLILMNNEQ